MQRKLFVWLILISIIFSCKGPHETVPFPEDEDEFPQPVPVTIKIPEGKKVHWSPSPKKMKKPVRMNIRYISSKDSVFRLEAFQPLPQPLDSHIIMPGQMPSVDIALKKLKKQKVRPSIILMGEPEKTKAALPVVENEFTKGLLELGQDQGLPGTQVHSIAQDRLGRLWFSTDNGLCFFDGETIYALNKKLGLSRNIKNNICIDKKGHIWAAGNGADEIIPEEGIVRHYGKKEGLYSDRVVAVDMDSTGVIYFSEAEGVDIYNPADQTCLHIGKEEGLSIALNINRVTTDSKGRIWVASNCGGVNIIDPANEKMYLLTDKQGLGNNDCRSIIADKQNKIWMGHWNGGVDCYDFETGILLHLREKNGLGLRYICNIMQDGSGLIWISCLDKGLDIFDFAKRRIAHLFGKEGVIKSTVLCSFEDIEGRIWFGSNGAGVVRYDAFNGDINNYGTKWLATKRPVLFLMEDSGGKIWISTSGAGINIYDPKAKSMMEFYQGTDWANAFQMDMKDDKKGHIYMCNDYNFVVYDTGQTYLNYWNGDRGLPNGNIRSMALFNDGVLLGSGGSLLNYDRAGNKFYILRSKDDSLEIGISCMFRTNNGKYWLGTYSGSVYLYDPTVSLLTHFSKEQGFSGSGITCFVEDREGRLWIGTAGNGIKLLDMKTKTVSTIDRANGIAEVTITSLLEKDNKIYAGTAKGLSVIDLSRAKPQLRNYGKSQGFRTSDFNSRAAMITRAGDIWWGIGDMLSVYRPTENVQRTFPPSITAIDIMEKEMHFGSDTSDLSYIHQRDTVWSSQRDTFYFKSALQQLKNSNMQACMKWRSTNGVYRLPTNLVLPYNLDHLTFHYAGNYTTNTDKTRYRYILEGADKQWSPIVNIPEADYRNIAPGNYVFKVCSKNFSGSWSESASFEFTITPPWWKTNIAYLVYVLLMIGIVFGYNRLRTGQLLHRQKELEMVVQERTKEIALQKQTVEEKQKEIVDSINYAKRIQHTLLTHEKVLTKRFSEHFILFEPKDIVSGDFYWSTKVIGKNGNELFYLAVCDSTGHGVPGAFMSLLNISFLNEAINEKHIHEPHHILQYVRERLVNSVSRDGAKDGMDGILLCFEIKGNELTITYSAGNNPPLLYSNENLMELSCNKMPIGKGEKDEIFGIHTINAKKGDIIYLYTDGFADQFGGPKGKKFKYRQLNEILLKNALKPLKVQNKILLETLNDWKGNFEQVDDICVIGIKL